MANIGTQRAQACLPFLLQHILGSTVQILIVLKWYYLALAAWVATAHQGKAQVQCQLQGSQKAEGLLVHACLLKRKVQAAQEAE